MSLSRGLNCRALLQGGAATHSGNCECYTGLYLHAASVGWVACQTVSNNTILGNVHQLARLWNCIMFSLTAGLVAVWRLLHLYRMSVLGCSLSWCQMVVTCARLLQTLHTGCKRSCCYVEKMTPSLSSASLWWVHGLCVLWMPHSVSCVTERCLILQLWEFLLIDQFGFKSSYESHWKSFRLAKKVLEDKLVGQKRHLRPLLISRTVLQHESLLERGSTCLTPTHRQILLNLLTLSTSHYSEVISSVTAAVKLIFFVVVLFYSSVISENNFTSNVIMLEWGQVTTREWQYKQVFFTLQVRSRAQVKLFAALDQFSYSYRVLIPQLVSHLQQDSSQFHEQFKVGLWTVQVIVTSQCSHPFCYCWRHIYVTYCCGNNIVTTWSWAVHLMNLDSSKSVISLYCCMLCTNYQLEKEINILHVPSLDTLYRLYQEESAILDEVFLRLNYID